MAGSAAEERIRSKVVAYLRRHYDLPNAPTRIIHELVLEQWRTRLDVASVDYDKLVVVEIKSEKDVLKRLPDQVRRAREVAQDVIVVVARKHVPAIRHMCEERIWREVYGPPGIGGRGGWYNRTPQRSFDNPDYVPGLKLCRLMTEAETGDGLERIDDRSYWNRPPAPVPGEMLKMLWVAELRSILATHKIHHNRSVTRDPAMLLCIEHMTGREIRRAVCAALRARPFARADDPITSAVLEAA